jgi:hypothetical protein
MFHLNLDMLELAARCLLEVLKPLQVGPYIHYLKALLMVKPLKMLHKSSIELLALTSVNT